MYLCDALGWNVKINFIYRMRCERVNMYISIYQDVDAVNPAKIGAEVSVNSTVDGNYQTRMVSNNPVSSKWGY